MLNFHLRKYFSFIREKLVLFFNFCKDYELKVYKIGYIYFHRTKKLRIH